MINNITPLKEKVYKTTNYVDDCIKLNTDKFKYCFSPISSSKPDVNLYIFDYANLIDDSDEQEMRK